MKKPKKIRYAVVGLGHIAQTAVLPAFKHARKNSELVALVSDNRLKLKELSKKYGVKLACHYTDFRNLMASGEVDAVYIATPNTYHRDYAEIAAAQGVHVLCEKPLAVQAEDCRHMIKMADENRVKLMTAYRLHFDAANHHCIKLARSKRLGDLKIFNSVFTMQVRDRNNIRLKKDLGGGALYDIGVYCINAARYLFSAEPIEVFATAETSDDPRFSEIDELIAVTLKFPDHRIANFVLSFGASPQSEYELFGTKGRLRLENAYDYANPRQLTVVEGEKETRRRFPKSDQFAPELLYFSNCILKNLEPEPSGHEGLIDIEIVEALLKSLSRGRPVYLDSERKQDRPRQSQVITKPGIRKPVGVNVVSPGGERG